MGKKIPQIFELASSCSRVKVCQFIFDTKLNRGVVAHFKVEVPNKFKGAPVPTMKMCSFHKINGTSDGPIVFIRNDEDQRLFELGRGLNKKKYKTKRINIGLD